MSFLIACCLFVGSAWASVQVIYINGPSSSGKTTLAKALQNEMDDLFLHIGFDLVLEWMPDKFKDWSGAPDPLGFGTRSGRDHLGVALQELVVGPFGKEVIDAYRQVAISLLQRGHKLIIDDVAFGNQEVGLWRELLKEYCVIWVGLTAPLLILENRERVRSDRIPGCARNQFWKVHQAVSYDLEFDTSQIVSEEIARIVKSYFKE